MKRFLILISVVLGLGFPQLLQAFKASELPPLLNFDRRLDGLPNISALAGESAVAAARLKDRIPGFKVAVDPLTGAPKFIGSTYDFLSGPNGQGNGISPETLLAFPANDPHRIIRAFLNEHSALFGHGAEVLDSAALTRDYATPHNGMRTVVWEQQLDGISVYGAVLIANITRKGQLVNLTTQFLPDVVQAANAGTPNRAALQIAPGVSAQQAVVYSAEAINHALTFDQLRPVNAAPEGPGMVQRFNALSVLNGETRAELSWLPLNRAALRLCWQVTLTSHARGETFLVIVDAETGEALLRRQLTVYITNATYNVWTSDSPAPLSPGLPAPGPTQPALVPRVLVVTNAVNTNASPNGWIDDPDNETRGNNVDAHLDRNADDLPDLPRPQGNPNRVFDFPINLNQSPTNSGEAAVVQLFYWVNWYHDKLYELGFTEASGNYQNNNFGRGGLGNDAIQADSQDGSGLNNANFTPARDGNPGRIQMYVFDGPTPNRDGDFDAEVMLHEATHGTSGRLVGGGVGISELQTGGMGEGWSDFYALSLLSAPGDNVGANYAMGGYITFDFIPNFQQNYYYGIRRYPYTTNLSTNPLTFKDIDPSQADPHTGAPLSPLFSPFDPGGANEVHNQGEIWCVTLWEARAGLINKFGYATGNQLMLQLVTDGMKLGPANPTFLEARDAIIQADLVNTGGANFNELWSAFAKRGMGGSATSPGSYTTAGVEEAFDLPGLAVKSTPALDPFTGNGNGVVDPNECNELNVVLVNNTRIAATGISATISTTTPGVLISQGASAYPNIPRGGTATNRAPFKFYTTPDFICGTPINFVLRIQSDQDTRLTKFRLPTGLVGPSVRFDNGTPILIPQGNPAGVDSPITVSGLDTGISKVTVSLHITHPLTFVLRLVLIGPDGTRVSLASLEGFGPDFGVSCSPDSQRTTFDDKASLPVNNGRAPFVGAFRPEQPLAAFTGKSGSRVNGTWRLHVSDGFPVGQGTIECWSLNISPTICTDGGGDCSTDLAVNSSASPAIILVESNLTYSITVTNRGPNAARNVLLTDILPAGSSFVSSTTSRGSCSSSGGYVNCSLGILGNGESASIRIVVRPHITGLITNVATVSSSATDAVSANNSSIVISEVFPPIAVIVPAEASLLSESIDPPNGGIDPGETVTLNLFLQNIGSLTTSNLVATLLSTGGVVNPSGPQVYGAVPAGGASVGRQFTFAANGTNGDVLSITLQLQDGAKNLGLVRFNYGLGGVASFLNLGGITIFDNAPASPYPSSISVSGLSGLIDKISVTLSNVNHTSPSDVDILLVGPTGRSVMLMSDAGAGYGMNNVNLTFDDAASRSLPSSTPIVSGIYKPSNFDGSPDIFPPPSPPNASGTTLSVFSASGPNGIWSLYVIDDTAGDIGRIVGGWGLTISTVDPVNPTADLAVTARAAPNPVLVGSNLTYTITVTNLGPKTATGVTLTNFLPASTTLVAATNSQGGASTVLGGQVIFALGTLTNQGWAAVTVIVAPSFSGPITNVATVSANETDRNPINSTATVVTTVSPASDLAVWLSASPDPATIGKSLAYTIIVTNKGPNSAFGINLSDTLPGGVTFVSATSSQGSCSQANGIVACSLGALPRFTQASITIVVIPPVVGPVTNRATVSATQPADLISTNNAAALVTVVNNPDLIIVPAGRILLAESGPFTGGIDPGETVTVSFGLKNIGIANTTALLATLRTNAGVTQVSGPQNYGILMANGPAVMQSFSFTAQGPHGGTITATLDLQDGANSLGSASFTFILGAVATLANGQLVSIPDNGRASPYPSSILVSNLAGAVSKVTVTLSNLSHAYPDDIDALLVGPNGQASLIMSDTGGGNSINNVTLTFDDAATTALPDSAQIFSGTYKPTNYGAGDLFPPPAPTGPYGSTLSVFNGSDPNGKWSLFVVDDTLGDLGQIADGWALKITTVDRINPLPAHLSGPVKLDLRRFQFTLQGEVGDIFIIEASADITSGWTPIATNTLSGVSQDFQDSNSASYGRRFYRVRRP